MSDNREVPGKQSPNIQRPQGEELRVARTALRDAKYDYEQLTRDELRQLVRLLPPGTNVGDTKEEMVRVLKRSKIR